MSWRLAQRARRVSLIVALALAMASPAVAQGCAQCRDNTATTPPKTQQAYRRAITLLGGVAALLFTGTVVTLLRQR